MEHNALSLSRPQTLADVTGNFSQSGSDISALVADILLSEDQTNQYITAVGPKEIVLALPCSSVAEQRIKGAILFLMLHKAASAPEINRDENLLGMISRDTDFVGFITYFYKLDAELSVSSLSFHASGTTSLIFKALTREFGICALKLIQAPYIRLPAIREATSNYARDYGLHIRHSPRIFASADTWITMEFIDGPNLNDYLNSLRLETTFLSDKYVSCIALLFSMIADALEYYQQLHPPIIHGDLTPFNIMVVHENNGPKSIKLIDFGPNYVLKDRVGSRRIFVEAFSRTELYTAPEVTNGQQDASIASDLYSLGMIGLDLLCSEPLRKEAVGVRLREIWQNPASVGVAQIIEDLIDNNPQNRALIIKREGYAQIYTSLDAALQNQVNVYRELVIRRREIEENGMRLAFDKPDAWKSVERVRRIFGLKDTTYNSVTGLQLLSADVNAFCQAVIVSSFLLYTTLDAKIAFFPTADIPFSQLLVQVVQFLPKDFTIGDFWGNLSGRTVALTFGLIAARYYANIFSSLHVTGLGGAKEWMANGVMRFNCLSYFVPIMIAIVYSPKLWPFCAFSGTLWPAVNNFACWIVAREACQRARTFSIEAYHRSETDRFLRILREWWLLMGSYSCFLGIIGILILAELAHDEPVYAGAVCAVNLFKIYRNNCGGDASFMAGHLSRLFFTVRRWREQLQSG